MFETPLGILIVQKNGFEAYFIDTQYVEEFRFAISWIDLKEEDRDEGEMATWYGSDPLLCNS